MSADLDALIALVPFATQIQAVRPARTGTA